MMIIETATLDPTARRERYQIGFEAETKRFSILRDDTIVAWLDAEASRSILKFAERHTRSE